MDSGLLMIRSSDEVTRAKRTGTHGLYNALKLLGFKPYHMAEVLSAGPLALRILTDGMNAELFHDGKPCKFECKKRI
jgi:hypothetical protein